MIPPKHAMYLLVPTDSNERMLHPGRVVQSGEEQLIADFDKAVAPPPGSDVSLFFELNGQFMQQGASIIAVREPDSGFDPQPSKPGDFRPRQVVVFKRAGRPVSAENRGSFRVSVVTEEIFARIDKDARCQIVDISPEGFGAITSTNCRLGTVVQVCLEHGGERLEGGVRVQTVKQIGRTKFRCGFFVSSDDEEMRATLLSMTTSIQRMQLQNLKRIA
jgi:hypothetical protein